LQGSQIDGAELPIITYHNRSACECRLINARDKRPCLSGADADRARVVGDTWVADIDIVISGREIDTGAKSDGDVTVACCIEERGVAKGSVEAASENAVKRISAVSRVLVAGGVAEERLDTVTRVLEAGGVVIEREDAAACVKITNGIFEERIITGGCIPQANCQAEKGSLTYTGVAIAQVSNPI
jgi:hypothetical protein